MLPEGSKSPLGFNASRVNVRGRGFSLDSDAVSLPTRPGSNAGGPDLGGGARMFVFILFTQVAQALMSYDGGATQMSTEAFLEHGWSSAMLGLLGAMDKFGQVATAFLWSYLLRRHSTKILLGLGLFSKAFSCLAFGILTSQGLMLLSKLGMGVFEALIGVWATVWVQGHAPEDAKARWLGLAGVSAGLGNGVGSAVAGFCARHLGYAFAFVVQALVLFVLWLVLVFCPSHWFALCVGKPANVETTADTLRHRVRRSMSVGSEQTLLHAVHNMSEDASDLETSSRLGVRAVERSGSSEVMRGLRVVFFNSLWFWTAMAISLSCFITTAIAYLWQNVVCNAWLMTSEEATSSFLITTGVGGFVGVSFGPKLFDGYLKGFADPQGKAKCLRWCVYLSGFSALLGAMCAGIFVNISWHALHHPSPTGASKELLGAALFAIFAIFGLINAMQGTLYGINTASVKPDLQTTAAGLTVSMQNIVGFAFGPLLPSITAEVAGSMFTQAWPDAHPGSLRSAQFSVGMVVALAGSWFLLFSARRAAQANDWRSVPRGDTDERPEQRPWVPLDAVNTDGLA